MKSGDGCCVAVVFRTVAMGHISTIYFAARFLFPAIENIQIMLCTTSNILAIICDNTDMVILQNLRDDR